MSPLRLGEPAKQFVSSINSVILIIAPQNLERFRQLVLADRGLFEQLRQTADVDGFVAQTVRIGAEQGCVFTEQEVRAALQACRRAWLERWI